MCLDIWMDCALLLSPGLKRSGVTAAPLFHPCDKLRTVVQQHDCECASWIANGHDHIELSIGVEVLKTDFHRRIALISLHGRDRVASGSGRVASRKFEDNNLPSEVEGDEMARIC